MTLMARGPDCVTRAWEGKAAVCIASGPSLTQAQLEVVCQARERDAVRVIVVNDNYLIAPWADVLYFADGAWHEWHVAGLEKSWPWVQFSAAEVKRSLAEFKGQKVTIQHPRRAKGPELFVLENDGVEGLSEKPTAIRNGRNSGYQALNIAVLAGANPIYLLGYDMRHHGARTHAHNGHKKKVGEEALEEFARKFETLKPPLARLGVRVVNCSPGSAIRAFPVGSLDELCALAV